MAEKRVAVRLAAVGGKQVRAELEGVGDAGVKGFGRMSKEAEIANARLAAFSNRVEIAVAVAVAAAAAAGIAMIRSGIETIGAQANLVQSLDTTTRSLQVLTFAGDLAGVSMDEIAVTTKKLTLKLSDAAGGTGTAVAALQRLHLTATDLQALPLDERIVAIQDAPAKFVSPAERAAVASALFGDKAALAFSRIDSATLRRASQDVTDFGVAVSDQDADQIRTAGDAFDRLGLVWLGLVWLGLVWLGLVWLGLVWLGLVWLGLVWHGLVWLGLTNQLTAAVAPALEVVALAASGATAAATGWAAVTAALGDYASKARDIGADVGQTLVGAFQSAEDAVGNFVKTGKLSFGDLVT